MIAFADAELRTAAKYRYLQRILSHRMEGIRLYHPLPQVQEFHENKAKIRIVRGSNRASKTMAGCTEMVRAVCRCDPYDKFPAIGNGLLVAKDMDNLADLWAKVSREGEFKIIRDERTRQWRAVRPDPAFPRKLDPYDAAYREKWRDAPPILPQHMYYTPAWEDAGRQIPRVVRFKTGWRVLFRSSNGDPQQGAHYNFVWFDEQLLNEEFFTEARRGLVALSEPWKHIPRFWWTATAQVTNPQLQDLAEKGEAGAKHVASFKLLIVDNPHIPDEEKQAFYEDLTPEERLSRWEGEFALSGKRIYGCYQPMGAHGCEPFPLDPTWARYLIVDPGTEFCATLFFAVPPDEKHVYLYEGFSIRQSNLTKWAAEVGKVGGRNAGFAFEAAICDKRAGRQHQMGLHISSTAEEYWKALVEANVKVRVQSSAKLMGGFFPGSDNIEAREQNLLQWMDIRGFGPFAGTAKLQIMRGVVPQIDHQLKRAHIDPKTGKRATKARVGPHDELDCLEYAAGHGLGYHAPARILSGSISGQLNVEETPVQHYRKRHPHPSRRTYGSDIEIGG